MNLIPKGDAKQALRIKRFLMAFDTYIIWMLIALFCYYEGLFARTLGSIYWFFGLIVIFNLALFLILISGLNKRFRDPSLTMLQIVLATIWTMIMAYCLDEGRAIMLLVYMVVFTFGTFRLNFRQFLGLSIFALLGYGSVIALLMINHPDSVNLRIELLYLGTLFAVLIWFSFIGSHINALRKRLVKTNIELEDANREFNKANALIRQSEERYRSILDNMEEAYYEVDLKGNFTFFNSTAVKNLGYTNEEMMGMNFQRFVDEDNKLKVFNAYHKVFTTKKSIRGFDWEFFNSFGRKMAVEASVSLIEDASGEPVGFRGVVRDVTLRKQAEENLRKSEERYRTILESIEEAYFELDLRGNYTFFNDFLCTIHGYSREELMGMNYRKYTTEESSKIAYRMFNEVYLTGKPANQLSYEIIKNDGSRIIVEMSITLMRSPSGEPVGFRGVGRDVTSRILSEKALMESEEQYRTIFESTATANIIVEENMIIRLANSNFEKITGYSKQELEGKMSWAHFVVNEDLDKMKHYHMMRRIDPESVPSTYEFRFMNRAGEVRDLFMNVAIIPGTKESIASMIDISDTKNLEEQLTHAQKMEAIGTLAGGIAHDFNNLLMGILGNVTLIRMNFEESHPYHSRLKSVEELVTRGSNLTKQLLGFARKGKYEVKPTDMGDFIYKNAEMFGRAKKEIHIHYRFEDGLWPVEIDRGQMEQVFVNMYINAWQAMPNGGELHLCAENVMLKEIDTGPHNIQPGNFVKITVTDTGVGMDEPTQMHIFEPFFTTKELGHGTGLGLASAYGIVKNHGGFIQVKSRISQGTSFYIYLPSSDKAAEGEFKQNENLQAGHETIILIDDEEMILNVGSDMLKALGYDVICASGGRDGLKIFEQNQDKAALVILDMIMPDFSGKETFEELRKLDPSVRVLLSSGYSIDGQAKQIMQCGCKGFIQKPFTISELSNKIRGIIGDRIEARNKAVLPDSVMGTHDMK